MHAIKQDIKNISSLIKRADFLRLNKDGQKWVSKSLVIQAAPRAEDTNDIRVGFTITKRTFKSAVKRNRIKRRLRAVAMDVLSAEAKTGCDYVLIGREDTLTKPYTTLVKDLRWCLRKMGYNKDTAS